mgnify:CR=1 FL=1
MQIKLNFSGETKEVRVKDGYAIEDLLKELKINKETVVSRMNGEIVPEEEKIKDNCTLELIEFVSSG